MPDTKIETGWIGGSDLCWISKEVPSNTPPTQAFEYLDEKFQASIKRILFSDGKPPR